MIRNIIFVGLLLLAGSGSFAGEVYELSTGNSSLKLNAKGEIVELGLAGELPFVTSGNGFLWEITLQQPSDSNIIGKSVQFSSKDCMPFLEKTANGIHISYKKLSDGVDTYQIGLKVLISVKDQAFVFSYEVENREKGWLVKEMRCPVFVMDHAAKTYDLLWPLDGGRRMKDFYADFTCRYPSSGSMQFLVFDSKDYGLYMASHDETFQTTYFKLNKSGAQQRKSLESTIVKFPNLEYGKKWHSPPLILMPYRGSWHVPAEYYRSWASTWYNPVAKPDWVNDITGWQLVIMKQQNGQVIWSYDELDRLVALGKERNLNVIGLYGWTSGGHDRGYPVYQADEAMGGERLLKEKIAAAQEQGVKIVLYVNGQLQDVLSEFYQREGKDFACVSERGEPYLEMWHKFADTPPRVHAYGCQSSDGWYNVLLSLAKQVNDLGADGIIYDQIGSPTQRFCYSKEHNHANPALAVIPGAMENLKNIQAEMHKINPDFIIMTEHITDGIQQFIDVTHGSAGSYLGDIYAWNFDYANMEKNLGVAFPELIRYIFPDILVTQRHQSPIMDKFSVNFGLFYGMQAELEYRYYPEKTFTLNGTIPTQKDFEGTDGKYLYLQHINVSESNSYLARAMDFVIANKEILRKGVFTDDQHIDNRNSRIKMVGLELPDRFGLLMWNPTSQYQKPIFDLKFKAKMVEVSSPEKSNASFDEPLPPNAVRLVTYSKR